MAERTREHGVAGIQNLNTSPEVVMIDQGIFVRSNSDKSERVQIVWV